MSPKTWLYLVFGVVALGGGAFLIQNRHAIEVSLNNSLAMVQTYQTCLNSCQQEFSSCQQSARSWNQSTPGQRSRQNATSQSVACADQYDACLSQCQVQQETNLSTSPPAAPSPPSPAATAAPAPQYYVNNQPTSTITCGQTFTFQIDNYTPTQVWLTRYKDNTSAPDVDGPLTVPLTYQTVCHQDEGTYRADLYILANGAKGSLLGSVTATIKAAVTGGPNLPPGPPVFVPPSGNNTPDLSFLQNITDLQDGYNQAVARGLKAEIVSSGNNSYLEVYDATRQTVLGEVGKIPNSAPIISGNGQTCVTKRGQYIIVGPNGKIEGVVRDYSTNLFCGTANQDECNSLKQYVFDINSQLGALPDGPHAGGSYPIQIFWLDDYDPTALADALPVSYTLPDGTTGNSCSIVLHGQSLAKDGYVVQNFLTGSLTGNSLTGNVGVFLEHEFLHCFGLDHAHDGNIMDIDNANTLLYTAQSVQPITGDYASYLQFYKGATDIAIAACSDNAIRCPNNTDTLWLSTNAVPTCVPAPHPVPPPPCPDPNMTRDANGVCRPNNANQGPNCYTDSEGTLVCDCAGGIGCKLINGSWVCTDDSGYPASDACLNSGGGGSFGVGGGGGGCSESGDPIGCGLQGFLDWLKSIKTN